MTSKRKQEYRYAAIVTNPYTYTQLTQKCATATIQHWLTGSAARAYNMRSMQLLCFDNKCGKNQCATVKI